MYCVGLSWQFKFIPKIDCLNKVCNLSQNETNKSHSFNKFVIYGKKLYMLDNNSNYYVASNNIVINNNPDIKYYNTNIMKQYNESVKLATNKMQFNFVGERL